MKEKILYSNISQILVNKILLSNKITLGENNMSRSLEMNTFVSLNMDTFEKQACRTIMDSLKPIPSTPEAEALGIKQIAHTNHFEKFTDFEVTKPNGFKTIIRYNGSIYDLTQDIKKYGYDSIKEFNIEHFRYKKILFPTKEKLLEYKTEWELRKKQSRKERHHRTYQLVERRYVTELDELLKPLGYTIKRGPVDWNDFILTNTQTGKSKSIHFEWKHARIYCILQLFKEQGIDGLLNYKRTDIIRLWQVGGFNYSLYRTIKRNIFILAEEEDNVSHIYYLKFKHKEAKVSNFFKIYEEEGIKGLLKYKI